MFGNSAAEGKPDRFNFGHFDRLTVAIHHNSFSEQMGSSHIPEFGQSPSGRHYLGPIFEWMAFDSWGLRRMADARPKLSVAYSVKNGLFR